MKKLLLIVPITLSGITTYGQRLPWFLNRDTSNVNNIPLYIYYIPGKPPLKLRDYEINLNPKYVTYINVTTGSDAIKLYGVGAKNGVITIYCKKNTKVTLTKLTAISKILDTYKISLTDRKLPVYIDSSLITSPSTKYYDLAKIKSVKIDTEFVSSIRFINILIIDQHPKLIIPKPGEIFIRGIGASK